MDSPRKDSNGSSVSIASQNPIQSMEKIQRVSQNTSLSNPVEASSLSTKIGEIQDQSLNQLHTKINDVMLPFLNTIFELKQDVQNAKEPSSRLIKNNINIEEIGLQLKSLSKDLEILISWCEGSKKQIEKVLDQIHPSDPKAFLKKPKNKKTIWQKFYFLIFPCNRNSALR